MKIFYIAYYNQICRKEEENAKRMKNRNKEEIVK